MIAKAIARHIRTSSRKASYVITPLRRQTVARAFTILAATNRRAVSPIYKVLASAFANAKSKNPELREEDVVITKFIANEGSTWKRFRAAAFGRAAGILKRTTHLTVELDRK